MDITFLLFVIVALAAGGVIGFLSGRSQQLRLEERNVILENQIEEAREEVDQEAQKLLLAEKKLSGLQADHRNLEEKLTDQKREFEKLNELFQDRFENLATRILDEKSKKFTEQNREKLDQLLKPLGERIDEFKKQVAETYDKETRDRVSLKEQISVMAELNQKMSEEAKNLTKALKGDSKQQGNWGEVILQRILEKSGLSKGREYEIQESTQTEDGRRLQPDVVIYLPEEKRLVVDSKVSLTAYERFNSAEEEPERMKALKEHILSLRNHVNGLSQKNYQMIHGGNSPDFVLLFIPIEPAFGLALQSDSNLYYDAFEKNIVIVSPSTLLATLATIDSVWKQERQTRNALEIASRGGALYDKFVLFAESMADIGKRLDQTRRSYDEAMNRLSDGPGNLVRQVDMLRELGARVSKQIPGELIETGNGRDEPS